MKTPSNFDHIEHEVWRQDDNGNQILKKELSVMQTHSKKFELLLIAVTNSFTGRNLFHNAVKNR